MHAKHTLVGLGPKFTPLHFIHGGVGGGVHGDDALLGGGQSKADGRESGESVSLLSPVALHSQSHSPHSWQP